MRAAACAELGGLREVRERLQRITFEDAASSLILELALQVVLQLLALAGDPRVEDGQAHDDRDQRRDHAREQEPALAAAARGVGEAGGAERGLELGERAGVARAPARVVGERVAAPQQALRALAIVPLLCGRA